MKMIELDASQWRMTQDFYNALLAAIGAPDWHGHNINALVETMIQCDDINAVSPPYIVSIRNIAKAGADTQEEIAAVQAAFVKEALEFRAENGRDMGVSIKTF